MKKALISPTEVIDGKLRIVEVSNSQFEVALPLFWVDCPDGITTAHLYNNGDYAEQIVTPKALTLDDFKKAHDNYLNAKAKERNYDSIHTAALRAAYPGPYYDEGLAYAQWMDACNVLGYQILAEVQAGTRVAPATIQEYIALLPVLVLP